MNETSVTQEIESNQEAKEKEQPKKRQEISCGKSKISFQREFYIPEKKIPLFSDVAKDWLEYKKLNFRESTWSVYEGYIRNHFKEFDEIKINRITTARVGRFITNRREGLKIACLR